MVSTISSLAKHDITARFGGDTRGAAWPSSHILNGEATPALGAPLSLLVTHTTSSDHGSLSKVLRNPQRYSTVFSGHTPHTCRSRALTTILDSVSPSGVLLIGAYSHLKRSTFVKVSSSRQIYGFNRSFRHPQNRRLAQTFSIRPRVQASRHLATRFISFPTHYIGCSSKDSSWRNSGNLDISSPGLLDRWWPSPSEISHFPLRSVCSTTRRKGTTTHGSTTIISHYAISSVPQHGG